MLCSKPLPTKASRHQKIRTSFATSLVVRPAVQTARHTSQLHRIPRTTNSQADKFILLAATFINRSICGCCDRTPDWATSQARPSELMRFPPRGVAHMRLTVPQEMAPSSAPSAQTLLLPVNRPDHASLTNAS